jgi:hypothetical protein
MSGSLYAKMRASERYNVELNATYTIKGRTLQHEECRITDLSAGGAKVRFSNTGNLKSGDVIALAITIPNTIMRITAEAEIMWTKQRFNQLISGLKFSGILSDSMIRQLIKKNQ